MFEFEAPWLDYKVLELMLPRLELLAAFPYELAPPFFFARLLLFCKWSLLFPVEEFDRWFGPPPGGRLCPDPMIRCGC